MCSAASTSELPQSPFCVVRVRVTADPILSALLDTCEGSTAAECLRVVKPQMIKTF